MAATFVDTNIILDVVTADPRWLDWSKTALETSGPLMANALVFSELCTNANDVAEVEHLLDSLGIQLIEIPHDALFLAAKVHRDYRQRGGSRQTGLPDFFIGAHAAVLGVPLLTRDAGRYSTYFPTVPLILPPKDSS